MIFIRIITSFLTLTLNAQEVSIRENQTLLGMLDIFWKLVLGILTVIEARLGRMLSWLEFS